MITKPPIAWHPAHPQNVNPRPEGVKFEAICLHTTAGGTTIQQLGAWFGGGNIAQGMRGSTHFGVDIFGKIGQFVSLERQPIANGAESGATAAIVAENPGLSANAYTISIEHLDGGVPGTVTQLQFEMSIWLAAWLWQEHIAPHAATTGATLDRARILGHYEFAPASRPHCPSWPAHRFSGYIAGMRARLETPVPPPPVIDWRARYLGVINETLGWQTDDEAGAVMRRERLYELAKEATT